MITPIRPYSYTIKPFTSQSRAGQTLVRFGENPNPKGPRSNKYTWKDPFYWFVAACVLTGGIGQGIITYNNYTKQKEQAQVVAQQHEDAVNKGIKTAMDSVNAQVWDIYQEKILARRQGEVFTPFVDMKDMDFVRFQADVDWQVQPDSPVHKDLKGLLNTSAYWTANSIFAKAEQSVIDALNKDPKQVPQIPIDKEQVNQSAEKAQSNIGTTMSAWNYPISTLLEERADGLLKKHTAQELLENKALVAEFQQAFLHGGTDFEGNPLPPLKDELAQHGIKLHSIRLKALKMAFDRITIPLDATLTTP